MSFRKWSCGHNHQGDEEGRVATCGDEKWYLLEYADGMTLHVKHDDGRFSPARWGESNGQAKAIAHQDGMPLYVKDCDGEWIEVP